MRTVKLCAIIAIGAAFGCAFDDAALAKMGRCLANATESVAGVFAGR